MGREVECVLGHKNPGAGWGGAKRGRLPSGTCSRTRARPPLGFVATPM
ncbi:hypothetical protein SF06_27140 [Pseudomonas flexibilis]|nr:hypothetical protein SF06_27140 [Pseudomonas flexibilis]